MLGQLGARGFRRPREIRQHLAHVVARRRWRPDARHSVHRALVQDQPQGDASELQRLALLLGATIVIERRRAAIYRRGEKVRKYAYKHLAAKTEVSSSPNRSCPTAHWIATSPPSI